MSFLVIISLPLYSSASLLPPLTLSSSSSSSSVYDYKFDPLATPFIDLEGKLEYYIFLMLSSCLLHFCLIYLSCISESGLVFTLWGQVLFLKGLNYFSCYVKIRIKLHSFDTLLKTFFLKEWGLINQQIMVRRVGWLISFILFQYYQLWNGFWKSNNINDNRVSYTLYKKFNEQYSCHPT